MKILITCDYYLPGWRAGGPIRSLSSLIKCLGGEFDFKVITRDRDYGDSSPYQDIKINKWQVVGNANVLYLSPFNQSLCYWFRLLQNTRYDLLYLNSFFSPNFTIKLLLLHRLGLSPKVPILLAARGELSEGALSLKAYKKNLYMILARKLGVYRCLHWQASSEKESADIVSVIQHRIGEPIINTIVVPDLEIINPDNAKRQTEKAVGALCIVFLSRICRMKNLSGALKILGEVKGRIQFDIFGPIEDEKYWEHCQEIMKSFSSQIAVTYKGSIRPERVISTLAGYHLFFLPTLGENYGHVILEALLGGCPVLISDQTPWRGLEEKGVGWDIPLNQPERYAQVIREFLDMDSKMCNRWSIRASEYGRHILFEANQKSIKLHRALFNTIGSKCHEL
jgi:glycosyltransferase involved in cell wall biosynthesis